MAYERSVVAPLLKVEGLEKTFVSGFGLKRRSVHAVNEVSFEVRAGEGVGLVGESGSGKSSVARLIARLTKPSGGKILLYGRDVLTDEPKSATRAYRRQVQMILQDPFSSLNPVHTIGYQIGRALQIHRSMSGRDRIETTAALLASVGLGSVQGIAERYPHELSGGQRQRVAIARTLAVEPSLIVADEPTSMLDVSVRIGILNLLSELREDRDIGLLLITHDLASARYATSRTLVMYAGRIVESGSSSGLIESPKHPYTQLLVDAVPRRNRTVGTTGSSAEEETAGSVPYGRDGCPFVARCPKRMPVCSSVMPGVEELGEGVWVRCHLYGPGRSSEERVELAAV